MFQNIRRLCGTLHSNIESSRCSDVIMHEKVGPRLAGRSLVFRIVGRSPCARGHESGLEVPMMDYLNSDRQTLLESSGFIVIFIRQFRDILSFHGEKVLSYL